MAPPPANLRSLASPDGALILDLEQNRMIRLNRAGGQVWLQLERGRTIDEIAQTIAEETGEDATVVLRDVRDFCLLLDSLLETSR